MPNKENIQKWVDALRSGKYGQARAALAFNGKYCCLGVACEVAIVNGLPVSKESVMTVEGPEICYDNISDVLPDAVQDWLGLYSINPVVRLADGSSMDLAALNDHNRWSFEQIADAIENNFLRGVTPSGDD